MSLITPYEEGSFTYRQHRLSYEIFGSGNRVLVYVHGLLLDSGLNHVIARRLAERGNKVVLVDLLGHGKSDRPLHASEHRMDNCVEQIEALLEHLGIEQAVVGGLSLGANVSLLAATNIPERIRGTIIEMPVLERAAPAVAMTFVPLLLALYYGRVPVRFVTRIVNRLPRTPYGPLNSLLNAASSRPEEMAAVLHGMLLGPLAPNAEARSEIQSRMLVIGHRADLIHPFSDATNLVKQVPGAELLEAVSMAEMRLHPKRLLNEIAAFLDDVWGGPAKKAKSA
jgi:pimeloyl-ACP methyl ester carboxylesterase